VPFRLLGVVADPNQAADLTGHAFAHYAASGTDVTLVCAGGRDWRGTERLPAMRRLGVRDLVLLDYDVREQKADGLADVFADVMAGFRPHVVVADSQPAIREAVASAFSRVRRDGRILGAAGQALLPVVGFQPAGQCDHCDRHTR